MNPLQSGIPSQYYTGSSNIPRPLAAASSQAQPQHSPTLSLALLSRNAHLALDQTEAQPNGHHQLLALLARNGIADGTLHLGSTQGADAHYQQQVNVRPQNDVANLTVRARLNAQAQYDIVGIDLYVPSSGRTESIALSVPLASAHTHAQTPSVSDHLALQYSRDQLTQALIRQNSPQDFSDAPLPSGASVTQSMVFSQDGSAGASADMPGPSRTLPIQSARSGPYPTSSQSGSTSSALKGSNSTRVQDPDNPGRTVTLGALRQRQKVTDPETGETVSISTLRQRQKVTAPETGETVSISTLRARQKVTDPETGETVSKAALQKRQKRRADTQNA